MVCEASNIDIEDSMCVDHAECLPSGDSFSCQCEEGYIGNGVEQCNDVLDCTYTFDRDEGPVDMTVRRNTNTTSLIVGPLIIAENKLRAKFHYD